MSIQKMYNPFRYLIWRIRIFMYDVMKNFILILIAFLAPYWFPITQKILNGQSVTIAEILFLILILIIPLLLLWQGERLVSKQKTSELKQSLKEAIKEALKEDREEQKKEATALKS